MLISGGNYKKIEPASGAIIMANGIFLIGAVKEFSFLNQQIGVYLAFLLLIAWEVIYTKLSIQFFYRDFLIPFLKDPVNSFAIGTWIDGVTVVCKIFLKYFYRILHINKEIAIINTFLLFFLISVFCLLLFHIIWFCFFFYCWNKFHFCFT